MPKEKSGRWLRFNKPAMVWLVIFGMFAGLWGAIVRPVPQAVAATNNTINFQARLMTGSGAIVPDGYYNVEFKIYIASAADGGETPIAGSCTTNPGGAVDEDCEWTERYYDSNGATAGNDNRVRVANGYLTVGLGSQTSFPNTIDWDQDLWIAMNVGGTTQTATPTWDGEMTPRLKLTGVPYAFRAGQLARLAGSGTAVLEFASSFAQNSVITLPDPGAGTATVCYQSSASCGFLTGAAGDYIQNQSASDQTANFRINGTGQAQSFIATTFDTASAVALEIGTTNTTQINVNEDAYIAAGKDLTLQSGSGVFTQNYGSSVNNTSAQVLDFTNTNSGATSTAVSGIRITPTGTTNGNANANTLNAILLPAVTPVTNNAFYGLNIGTGYDDIIRYNGNQIISGAGLLQNVAVDSSLTYSNLQKVGALNAGSITSGFGTISTGNNITTTAAVQGGTATFTGSNALTLGTTGTATGAIVFRGSTAASGTITLVGAANPSTNNYTLTIPTLTNNAAICTDNAICTGYQAAPSSGSFLYQVPLTTAANTVTPTADGVVGLTVNGTSGVAATAAIINQSQSADGLQVNVTGGSQTNGILLNRTNAGTLSNGIHISNTSGTLTNGVAFSGTIGTDIYRSSGVLTLQGAGGVTITAAGTTTLGLDAGGAGTVSVGNTNATTINIGGTSGATTTIAGGNVGHTVNIATGGTSAGQAVTVGSIGAVAGNVTAIQGGNLATGTGAIAMQAASGGLITIGTTNNNLVTIGGASSTTTLQGTVSLSAVGAATANAASLCRDTSTGNVIACDTTNTTGRPFLQGGNTFGASGVLGTNDNNYVQFETNNTVRGTFDTSNNFYFGNGITAASPNNFVVSVAGSTTAGTAGASLTLQGGAGASSTTGSAGGNILIAGGNAGGSGDNAGGTVTLQGGLDSNAGTAGGVLVKNAADSAVAFRVQNAAGTATILNVDSSNGYVGIGTASPARPFHLVANSSAVNAQLTKVEQLGTGDVGIELAEPGQTFYVGVDSSDHKFKISSNAVGSTIVIFGYNTIGPAGADAANSNHMNATKFTASATGTINTIYAYIESDISLSPNNKGQAAVYDDNSGTPGNRLAYSLGETTLTGGAWNAFTISGTTVTSGQTYWLVYNTNGNLITQNNLFYDTAGATANQVRWANQTYGTWPTTWPGTAGSSTARFSIYAPIVTNTSTDNLASSLFQMSATGQTIFQNSTDDAGAFQVQNAAGTNLIDLNTATRVLNLGVSGSTASTSTVNIATSTGGTQAVHVGSTGSGTAAAGTTVNIQGGTTADTAVTIGTNGAGGITIDSGTTGNVNVGTGASAKTVRIGSTNTTSSTVLQAGTNNLIINTGGTVRATFDTSNVLYVGNGVTAAAPNAFTIRGTGSATTAVAGGALTLQGGNATVGNANGGNVTITGGTGFGTGVRGLVVMDTPTFTTAASDANCYTAGALVASSCTISTASVNNSSAVIVGFNQTGQTASLPDPTITTAGRIIYVTAANGSSDFTLSVNGGGTGNTIAMRQNTTATMIWNGNDWTAAGASSSTTLQSAYDSTLSSAGGAEIILNNTATSNGLTVRNNASNPIIGGGLFEVQTSIGTNLFSVNNNISELVANGGGEDSATFATNWTALGTSTITRTTTGGQYATGIAGISVAAGTTAGNGVRNNLATNPATNTTYMVSFTARLASGTFTDLRVDYTPTGAASGTQCTANQTIITSGWARITCELITPATTVTNPDILIYQSGAAGAARTFYVDNLSMTLADDAGGIPNNVQIGGGIYGGAPTLFTLDRSSAPPVANGNTTYLGSMYYDTVTGRIQCYEADGWGACGSAPDNIITLSPEYTGAVLNGSGIGTMTADFCANQAGVLTVNTGFCASGISRNYYKWTSPQATQQTYSIYVSYKLPTTFKTFSDANTIKLTALTDSTTNGMVDYQVFRSTGSAVSSCGSQTTVTTPSANTWYQVSFAGDETACGFVGGDYIIFKINVRAQSNASVYVENLDFTYLNT